MDFLYRFPAVRGTQAEKEYYVTMVPLKLLPRIFNSNSEGFIPAEFRAQRQLNEQRIPDICSYILDNRKSYVFSALSASIDGEFKFVESNSSKDVGVLEIPMTANFLINDGQHRKKAIEEALLEDSTLGDETISIVLFKDAGLAKSQQMFTDLNKHAVKTSNSISILYDSRDPLVVATKEIVKKIRFFRMFVDKEKDNLGKNSSNLFTLNNLYKANQRVVHNNFKAGDEKFLLKFWSLVAENINEWNDVMNKSLTKKSLRENYIITLSITLQAIGKLGSCFFRNDKLIDMSSYLTNLRKIDWLRNNDDWKNKPIADNGKVLNNEEAINLLYLTIKEKIGISLADDECRKIRKKYGKNGK